MISIIGNMPHTTRSERVFITLPTQIFVYFEYFVVPPSGFVSSAVPTGQCNF
jgi:hypothetical protein